MWAVSIAIDEAPRSEIDTLVFLSTIESLIPSPTKQTLQLMLELRHCVYATAGVVVQCRAVVRPRVSVGQTIPVGGSMAVGQSMSAR